MGEAGQGRPRWDGRVVPRENDVSSGVARCIAALQSAGYRVVRVSADAVMGELGAAVEEIRSALQLAIRSASSDSGGGP